MVDAFLDWIASQPPLAVYVILMALSTLENIFPPVPADVAVVLGAFLSRRGVTSPVLLGVLCWVANLTSAAGMYFYARSHGRRFFERGWRRRLMPPSAVEALEQAYAKHGVLGIFVSRFLPGVRAAVTPFAGVVGMKPVKVLLPAATASAIWYTFLVVVGTILARNWETARGLVDNANRVLGLIALASTAAIVWWLWRHSKKSRRQSPDVEG